MRVKKSVIYFLFICVFIFISGCASSRTIGKIPTESADFLLSENDLKNEYPEIVVYEIDRIEKPFGYCTGINDLINAWGEPEEKGNEWRFHGLAAGSIIAGSLTGGGPFGAARRHRHNFSYGTDPYAILFLAQRELPNNCPCRHLNILRLLPND